MLFRSAVSDGIRPLLPIGVPDEPVRPFRVLGRGALTALPVLEAILELKLMVLANGLGVGMRKRVYLSPSITVFLYSKLFLVNFIQLHKTGLPWWLR